MATAWGQADWPQHSSDYASTGFSRLSEITPKNISNLHQVCTYALPDETTFESSLVEINGTLYFTSSEYTYAIDAASCALKWRVRHEMEGQGGTVRGVAFANGRVYRGFRDGRVIAYNARNGEQVWSAQLKETNGMPATIAASPLVWNGMLFIGTSGAERACGCVIAGLDAATSQDQRVQARPVVSAHAGGVLVTVVDPRRPAKLPHHRHQRPVQPRTLRVGGPRCENSRRMWIEPSTQGPAQPLLALVNTEIVRSCSGSTAVREI